MAAPDPPLLETSYADGMMTVTLTPPVGVLSALVSGGTPAPRRPVPVDGVTPLAWAYYAPPEIDVPQDLSWSAQVFTHANARGKGSNVVEATLTIPARAT